MADLAVFVPGLVEPQGSMKHVGQGRIQPSNAAALKRWRSRVAAGAALLRADHGTLVEAPVAVTVTFTCELPPSIRPAARLWPARKASGPGRGGDVDKLARAVLDGLVQGQLLADDSLVVELTAVKAYTHTPDVPDVRDRPGALIRVHIIGG